MQFSVSLYSFYPAIQRGEIAPVDCIANAKELGFVHPATGEYMQFDSPLPAYFNEFLTKLRKESRQ